MKYFRKQPKNYIQSSVESINYSNSYDLEYLAENTSSVRLLNKLANSDDVDVLSSVAFNPNTPPHILDKLAKCKYYMVVSEVASNPNTSTTTLEKLAKNSSILVLQGVAENPNCPIEVLKELCYHPADVVRNSIADNASTPTDLLLILSNDSNTYVSYHAKQTLQNRAELETIESSTKIAAAVESIYELSENDRYDLARWSDNPRVLKRLAADESDYVLDGLTTNPNTPSEILADVAKRGGYEVRVNVADNPNTDAETLEMLSHDTKFVRILVAGNPSTPDYVLDEIARRNDGPRMEVSILKEVAKNPNASQETLEYLLNSEYPEVVEAANNNLTTRGVT